jgi:hypothetical protein
MLPHSLAAPTPEGIQQSPVLVGVGEADDRDYDHAAMTAKRRVIIRITPRRAGPDRQG